MPTFCIHINITGFKKMLMLKELCRQNCFKPLSHTWRSHRTGIVTSGECWPKRGCLFETQWAVQLYAVLCVESRGCNWCIIHAVHVWPFLYHSIVLSISFDGIYIFKWGSTVQVCIIGKWGKCMCIFLSIACWVLLCALHLFEAMV